MKKFASVAAVGLILFVAAACNVPDRVSRLEKQNEELKAEMTKNHAATAAVADYDLQAKGSKDAKIFFNEGWRRDKDTQYLDYSNHYNKAMNKCFILVEHHYAMVPEGSWGNDMMLWDVYEPVKYGSLFELHLNNSLPNANRVSTCESIDNKCTNLDEFNGLVRPYLNN
jgi:hypothetical protein